MFAFLRQLYDRTDSSSSSTRLVEVLVADAGARLRRRRFGLLLGAFLEVDEDVQVIANQLGRRATRRRAALIEPLVQTSTVSLS